MSWYHPTYIHINMFPHNGVVLASSDTEDTSRGASQWSHCQWSAVLLDGCKHLNRTIGPSSKYCHGNTHTCIHTHEENNQKPMIAVHCTSILIMCTRASITHCSDKLFLTISRCPYLCSGPLPAHCSPPTQPPRLTHYLPTLHTRWDSSLSRTHRVGVQHITNRLHEGRSNRAMRVLIQRKLTWPRRGSWPIDFSHQLPHDLSSRDYHPA